MIKFLLGFIAGIALSIWLLRKQLFEVESYPDIEPYYESLERKKDSRRP